jgi:uncharacterized protein (DUF1800 family)
MFSLKSHKWLRIVSTSILLLLPLVATPAQADPDPNSPTPVLLTEPESTRALAAPVGKARTRSLTRLATRAFMPDQKVELFVANLSLLEDEGASAFRMYMTDVKGREYRIPVLEVRPPEMVEGVYSIVIKLTDEIGYWQPPTADGDVLLRLTWRGLTSNSVRLGFGKVGGDIKDAPGSTPMPLSSLGAKTLDTGGKDDVPTNELAGYRWSGDRMRFLQQATFGPTTMEDYRVRRIGLRAWLADQFTLPYPTNPYPVIPLKSTTVETAPPLGCGPRPDPVTPEYQACVRDHYTMYPIQTWFFKEAFYGTPQLRHRVTWALSQIWVISGVDTQQSSWMIEYHQQLSKNAFGNYRQLMYDLTLNPGMGNYLDMMRSTRTNPNENYPREILQLFSIGLFMLNPDGTLQLDGQGNPIPTYDQTTVNNFTKVFTGWRDCRTGDLNASCPDAVLGTPDYKDPMSLNPGQHDITTKTLLSYPGSTTTNIAACAGCTNAQIYTYAYNSLNQALDNIYRHPNVAPFVSKLLIQHMVTSDPTPAYVGRVSAVFTAHRDSPNQLQEVVKAILLDPEARGDVKTDPRYGKLREPVQLLTNVLRNFDVASANLAGQSDGVVNNSLTPLGQNVFNSPTVFNYYQPNYVVPGTTILGPEYGIYTTGTAIGRANLFATYAFNGLTVAAPDRPNGTRINLAEAQAMSAADTSGNQLLDYLNAKMMYGTMSPQMRNAILPAVVAASASNHLTRAQHAVYLIATSSQFQVQR